MAGHKNLYRSLDPAKIVSTLAELRARILERFPDGGLSKVAGEVLEVAKAASITMPAIQRPHRGLRAIIWILVLSALGILAWIFTTFRVDGIDWSIQKGDQLIQGVEASIASLGFLGAGIAYLFSLETRSKRRKALAALHELRALAHVIDMHQLTKDPERVLGGHSETPSSPKSTLTPFLMGRYLDYCSELLSLLAKIGALYVQDFHDAVAVSAVDEVETLTNGLSRKIWQKITILNRSSEGS